MFAVPHRSSRATAFSYGDKRQPNPTTPAGTGKPPVTTVHPVPTPTHQDPRGVCHPRDRTHRIDQNLKCCAQKEPLPVSDFQTTARWAPIPAPAPRVSLPPFRSDRTAERGPPAPPNSKAAFLIPLSDRLSQSQSQQHKCPAFSSVPDLMLAAASGSPRRCRRRRPRPRPRLWPPLRPAAWSSRPRR